MNRWLALVTALLCAACAAEQPSGMAVSTAASAASSVTPSARPRPVVRSGESPVLIGEPIDPATLTGRIVFDDFEDIYTMAADGSDLRRVTTREGAEFDGSWSPDGQWIVYRDSRRERSHAAPFWTGPWRRTRRRSEPRTLRQDV